MQRTLPCPHLIQSCIPENHAKGLQWQPQNNRGAGSLPSFLFPGLNLRRLGKSLKCEVQLWETRLQCQPATLFLFIHFRSVICPNKITKKSWFRLSGVSMLAWANARTYYTLRQHDWGRIESRKLLGNQNWHLHAWQNSEGDEHACLVTCRWIHGWASHLKHSIIKIQRHFKN